uniref:Uncharacterized protein n=1 Tax=Aegilops tauschii subsp. strangulata TaxID=200361 RepID=A0A453KBC3_AEGTS
MTKDVPRKMRERKRGTLTLVVNTSSRTRAGWPKRTPSTPVPCTALLRERGGGRERPCLGVQGNSCIW